MASPKRSDGEGSLYQQHDPDCERPVNARGESTCKCRWRGALVIGWHDKKPIRKRVTAATRAGAAAKLRKLGEDVQKGQLPHGRIPTTGEWLTYWLENVVAKRNRPGTVRTYRTQVDGYLVPLLGHHRLDRLTPEHIADAWDTLRETGRPDGTGKPLSANTVHHAHSILSRALKVAQQRGKVTNNAATLMDAPPRVDTRPVILDQAQAKAVIAASRDSRNAARWTVAFSLGLRQGEALGLRWSDVDLDAGIMTVRHSINRVKGQSLVLGPTKSGKERDIVLPAPLLAELKAHRTAMNAERLAAGTHWANVRDWTCVCGHGVPDSTDGFLFPQTNGRPIDAKEDWKAWKRLLTAAKVRDVKGHSTRHTAATILLALGVQIEVVKEILGHSSLTVTMIYQHRVDDLHLEAAQRMSAAYWD